MATLQNQIRRVFNLRPASKQEIEKDGDGTLGYMGYPQLFQRNIFFNANQRKSWNQQRRLELPTSCCVCDEPSKVELPCIQSGSWWQRSKLMLVDVPHCETHATGSNARLIALPIAIGQQIVALRIIAQSQAFLAQIESFARQGAPPPPWEIFPGYPRDSSGWRQGDGEFWWNEIWAPYWNPLSKAQREAYLTNFPPPEDWQDLR